MTELHAMIHGVDVSSFQGTPAQWQPAAGKIEWAGVKITELEPSGERYVNPDAAVDWAALKAAGLGRVAYLFGHPATQVSSTVAHFTEHVRALGLTDHDAICLDHEVSDGRSAAEVSAWARAVVQALKHTFARRPLVYTFLRFAEEGNCQGLGLYPLWIADPSSAAGRPRVPHPWKDWAIHQYVTGGRIDRDVASFADHAAMAAHLGKAY